MENAQVKSAQSYGIFVSINGVTVGGAVAAFDTVKDAKCFERKLKAWAQREIKHIRKTRA